MNGSARVGNSCEIKIVRFLQTSTNYRPEKNIMKIVQTISNFSVHPFYSFKSHLYDYFIYC